MEKSYFCQKAMETHVVPYLAAQSLCLTHCREGRFKMYRFKKCLISETFWKVAENI